MQHKTMKVLAGYSIAGLLALVACGLPKAPEPKAPPQQAEAPPPPIETKSAAALTAAGKPETVAQAEEDGMQYAASVVEMTYLQKQGDLTVKLFGTAGGDPAMNGLYTYIAFFTGPARGWKVFRLGDFLEYRILSESPGRVDLELKESVMNDATGEIGSKARNVIVGWKAAGDAPETIDVSPAR